MDPDVVRVRIELPVLRVGDDHLRPFHADEADEPPDRFVERGVREVVGPSVDLGLGHPGVVVAEQVHRRVADRGRARLELAHPDPSEVGADLGCVDRGVQDVARLTTRAAHEHSVDALVVVARDRARTPSTPRRRDARAPRAGTADCRHDRPGIASRPTLPSLRWSIRFPAVRRFPIVAAAVGTLLGLLGAPPASAALIARNSSSATRLVRPSRPAAGVHASARTRSAGGCDGIQCATLGVPVDYRTPGGQMVDIAVARLPATDPGHRIGSLVVNYGGPGDPGTQTLRLAGKTIPAAVRDRFDIVSFDPRGTGASKPIDCIDDPTADRLVRRGPDSRHPGRSRPLLRRHQHLGRPRQGVHRQVRHLARRGRHPQRRPRPRTAPERAGRRRSSPTSATRTAPCSAPCTPRCTPTASGPWCSTPPSTSPTLPSRRSSANAQGFEKRARRVPRRLRGPDLVRFHSDGDPDSRAHRAPRPLRERAASPDHRRAPRRRGRLLPRTGRRALRQAAGLARARRRRCSAAEQGDGTILQLLADTYTGRDANGHYDNIQEAIGSIRCADRRRRQGVLRRATGRRSSSTRPSSRCWVGSSARRPSAATPASPRPRPASRSATSASPTGATDPDRRARPTTRRRPTPGAVDLQQRIARLATAHVQQHRARLVRQGHPVHRQQGRPLPAHAEAAARRGRAATVEQRAIGAAAPPPTSAVARDVLPREVARGSGSLGRPSTRSPRMLRMMLEVPPSIVLACARRKPRATDRESSVSERIQPKSPSPLSGSPSQAVPPHALEVDGELLHALVVLGLHQLGDRAFGSDLGAALALVRRRAGCSTGSAGRRSRPAPAAGASAGRRRAGAGR